MSVKKMLEDITKITLIFMMILIGMSSFFEKLHIVVISALLATMISLLCLQLIALSTLNLKKAKWRSYIDYVVRMIVYSLGIVIAIKFKLNLVIFLIGLLLSKIAIIIYGIKRR